MRHILILSIISMLLGACRKEIKDCKDEEITGRDKAVDISAIWSQQILDTLAKYPQLQPFNVFTTMYYNGVMCNVYYKDLLIFTDTYTLNKQFGGNDTLTSSGRLLRSDPGISLEPTVTITEAYKEAKKHVNFDNTCIKYRLGLFNSNYGNYSLAAKYELVWKIMDSQNPYIYVIINAVNKQVLMYRGDTQWPGID